MIAKYQMIDSGRLVPIHLKLQRLLDRMRYDSPDEISNLCTRLFEIDNAILKLIQGKIE